ncbi:sigma-70 family RNA polymerase sigma factor [uncultured Clostridium sp.]|uniref:sigma-70 family RNA polymerase sigma factor n=1 Tax=uncultured Clostridium sp. TaxID=59620 RepID=UPI0028E8E61C|nr:sigma-70 family RNA polymerase sigma factor [uncultured Clostridium sp.]
MERVEDHMGLVNWIASKYYKVYKERYEYDDLVQVACIGLCKAIKGFKPELGYEFTTYAVPKIKGQVAMLIRDDRYYPIHKKQRFNPSSAFISLNQMVSDEGSIEFIDTIKDRGSLDNAFERIDLEDVLSKLPSLERKVIHLYYFEDLTQAEIGKLLGMTQANVSRVIIRALEKLRRYLA